MEHLLGTKLYFTISEVVAITGLPPYTLRAWEKEFSCLRPRRVHGKNRAYRHRDIGILLLIKRLLYQEGYTVKGAKQRFKKEPDLVRQAIEQIGGSVTVEREAAPAEPAEPRPVPRRGSPASACAPGEVLRRAQWVDELRQELRAVLELLS